MLRNEAKETVQKAIENMRKEIESQFGNVKAAAAPYADEIAKGKSLKELYALSTFYGDTDFTADSDEKIRMLAHDVRVELDNKITSYKHYLEELLVLLNQDITNGERHYFYAYLHIDVTNSNGRKPASLFSDHSPENIAVGKSILQSLVDYCDEIISEKTKTDLVNIDFEDLKALLNEAIEGLAKLADVEP